jgi:CIC family chloride channel protein
MAEDSIQPNVPRAWSGLGLSSRFWAMIVLSGIGGGISAIALMALLRLVQHLAYGYSSGYFLAGVERAPFYSPLVALGAAAIIGGIVWYLLRRFSPGGVGLLESVWRRTGELPLFKTLANAATEMIIVGLGAALGREGAPKDAAAAISSKLADLSRLSPSERRLLVACGAGAGLAAVYNVPLGGALFALEVLLGTLSLPLVLPALAASGIATAVAWLYLPNHPVYRVPAARVTASEVIFATLLGPLVGLAGVGYVRLIAWSKAKRPSGAMLFPSLSVVFLALGATAIVYPQLLGNGLDLAQLAFTGKVAVATLAVLLILRPLFSAACLRSGALGGLLTPTLCFGALAGGLAGAGWLRLWPGAPLGLCALIGAAAMIASTMQAPLTAVVLVIELTGRVDSVLVPVILAVAGAALIGRTLEECSIYSAPLRLGLAGSGASVGADGAGSGAKAAAEAGEDVALPLGTSVVAPKAVSAQGLVVREAQAQDAVDVYRWLPSVPGMEPYRRTLGSVPPPGSLLVAIDPVEGAIGAAAMEKVGGNGKIDSLVRIVVKDDDETKASRAGRALLHASQQRLVTRGAKNTLVLVPREEPCLHRVMLANSWVALPARRHWLIGSLPTWVSYHPPLSGWPRQQGTPDPSDAPEAGQT